jgi:hypothetical protein
VINNGYQNYIHFSKQSAAPQGRHVYINPDLILPFLDIIDLKAASGIIAVQLMESYLKGGAGNLLSAATKNKANRFFRDFGQSGRAGMRVYFDILQDDGNKGKDHRGAGVYVYDVRRLNRKGDGTAPGLYYADFNQSVGQWATEAGNISGRLEPKFVVAASRADGVYDIEETTKHVSKAFLQDKTPYSLYYSPDYTLDSGALWVMPQDRISSNAGPGELAGLLDGMANQSWGNERKHNIHVFGDGVKTLLAALKAVDIVGSKGSFSDHTFKFYAPSASIAVIRQALGRVGVKFDLNTMLSPKVLSPAMTKMFRAYQRADAFNVIKVFSGPRSQTNLHERLRQQSAISLQSKSFLELCRA